MMFTEYLLENWHKFVLVALVGCMYSLAWQFVASELQVRDTAQAIRQLSESESGATHGATQEHTLRNAVYIAGWGLVGLFAWCVFIGDLRRALTPSRKMPLLWLLCLLPLLTGCYRPFEPVKLEVVGSNEEAFLLPFLGDGKSQTSSANEEYLTENLVYTKQVKIPQQWVKKGYETIGPNGVWQDAAVLIRVDKSPVTREWTADSTRGTSVKNEAIWVMTSDGVEFSTGWTITARIATREDAVKFLHNYPNGSLEKVLDSEVRAYLQAAFGLEVTDLAMETLRKASTPHMQATIDKVSKFFKTRGIEITNLGISGGFVYKDPTIMAMLVKVFNAEQQSAISKAENAAQEDLNKKALSIKKTEADGIKAVADAKFYEIEKTKENLHEYVMLKQLELQKEQITKWDGSFPQYFMVTGSGGASPSMLLQLPKMELQVKKGTEAPLPITDAPQFK